MPAVVEASGVVARSADAAVLLAGVSRYTCGLAIDLAIRQRVDPEPTEQMFPSFGGPLLVGVELADGRTVVAGNPSWEGSPDPDELMLVHRGGGGGGREWSSQLWLTPAPPPGDLVLVVASSRLGLDESRLVVPGDALRRAADRTEVLWPREPDRVHPPVEPDPVDVPPGGWFARALAGRAARPTD